MSLVKGKVLYGKLIAVHSPESMSLVKDKMLLIAVHNPQSMSLVKDEVL